MHFDCFRILFEEVVTHFFLRNMVSNHFINSPLLIFDFLENEVIVTLKDLLRLDLCRLDNFAHHIE